MENLIVKVIDTAYDYQILYTERIGDSQLDYQELPTITRPEGIDASKGVVFYGVQVSWLMITYYRLLSDCAWIAVFYPNKHVAIIVASQVPERKLFDTIAGDEILDYTEREKNPKVIAMIGPPHSGKSVFLHLLKQALISPQGRLQDNNVHIFRACPDGEGNWSSVSDPELVKKIRRKNTWTDKFARDKAEEIANVKRIKKVVLVDCGGKIDHRNAIILNECTHAIIVSSKPEDIPAWREACATSNLQILAEVHSVLEFKCELLPDDSALAFTFGILERGAKDFPKLPEELLRKITA